MIKEKTVRIPKQHIDYISQSKENSLGIFLIEYIDNNETIIINEP